MLLSFETPRLSIAEITSNINSVRLSQLLAAIPQILTPEVVENLPPYFHDINTQSDARVWYERMMRESRLWIVTDSQLDLPIGFIFAFVECNTAHIGYLLNQASWGKGLASELLRAFIDEAANTRWHRLIGGVDRSNIASTKLLLKLGFVEQLAKKESEVVFYEYWLVAPGS